MTRRGSSALPGKAPNGAAQRRPGQSLGAWQWAPQRSDTVVGLGVRVEWTSLVRFERGDRIGGCYGGARQEDAGAAAELADVSLDDELAPFADEPVDVAQRCGAATDTCPQPDLERPSDQGTAGADTFCDLSPDGSRYGDAADAGPGDLDDAGPGDLDDAGPGDLDDAGPGDLDDAVAAPDGSEVGVQWERGLPPPAQEHPSLIVGAGRRAELLGRLDLEPLATVLVRLREVAARPYREEDPPAIWDHEAHALLVAGSYLDLDGRRVLEGPAQAGLLARE